MERRSQGVAGVFFSCLNIKSRSGKTQKFRRRKPKALVTPDSGGTHCWPVVRLLFSLSSFLKNFYWNIVDFQSLFNFQKFLNWRIVVLLCCVDFCHASLFSFFKNCFYLKDNCFTILCRFLPHINMNQPQVSVGPLPLEPPSTSHPVPPLWVVRERRFGFPESYSEFPVVVVLRMVVCVFPALSFVPPSPPRTVSTCWVSTCASLFTWQYSSWAKHFHCRPLADVRGFGRNGDHVWDQRNRNLCILNCALHPL